MKRHLNFFIPILVFLSINLYGLDTDGDMSLGTIIAPRPKVLGLSFNDSVTEVDAILKQMGMSSIKNGATHATPPITYKMYAGVPSGLWVQKGKSQFLYFKNKLLRMDFTFDPSYENFLLIRSQLMQSLGKRFSLEEKKEAMDDFLKAHLATLSNNEYNDRTEQEIMNALKRGKTFFYYSLADNKKEMNVTLSYFSAETQDGESKPQLSLHYSSKQGLEILVEYEEAQKTKILPE